MICKTIFEFKMSWVSITKKGHEIDQKRIENERKKKEYYEKTHNIFGYKIPKYSLDELENKKYIQKMFIQRKQKYLCEYFDINEFLYDNSKTLIHKGFNIIDEWNIDINIFPVMYKNYQYYNYLKKHIYEEYELEIEYRNKLKYVIYDLSKLYYVIMFEQDELKIIFYDNKHFISHSNYVIKENNNLEYKNHMKRYEYIMNNIFSKIKKN